MIIPKKEPCFFATGNYTDFSSTKNALAGDLSGRRDERAPPGVPLDGLRRHRRGRVVEEQARPHEADDRTRSPGRTCFEVNIAQPPETPDQQV